MTDVIDFDQSVAWPVVVRARLTAYFELTKPRIAAMVLVAATLGFYLALPGEFTPAVLPLFLHMLVGTALVGGGANALNQWIEADHDGHMARTQSRPLPSGRLSASEVLTFGVGISVVGVGYLALFASGLAAVVAALSSLLYLFAYTPLKRVTHLCVFIGAIPGAMPPLIGWAAVAHALPAVSWVPFAILYFWQLPHVAAISWLYREEYARAGYIMMPVGDTDGDKLHARALMHTLALIVASLFPMFHGLTGELYGVGAALLGAAFLAGGILFAMRRTKAMARYHLLASVIYLPLLFALMMIDKIPHA